MTDHVAGERQSRRRILAALGGGLAAVVAQSLGRPISVAATHGEPDFVALGHDNVAPAGSSTTVTATTNQPAVGGVNSYGIGVRGVSGGGTETGNTSATGVLGVSGIDVDAAANTSQTGIYGFSNTSLQAAGVWGDSLQGTGVYGSGDSGVIADGFWGLAAFGHAATGGIGVLAEGNTGVFAYPAGVTPPNPPANTAIGAYAPSGKNAAHFNGRTVFSRSGKLTVPAGSSSVAKTGVQLASSSLILAVVQSNRSGFWVTRAVPTLNTTTPSSSSFRVYLNATVPSGTAGVVVAFFIVN